MGLCLFIFGTQEITSRVLDKVGLIHILQRAELYACTGPDHELKLENPNLIFLNINR